MIILGVDPGTVAMGFGLLENRNDKATLIRYGVILTKPRSPIGERLSFLYKELEEIINSSKPDVVAVEQPFMAKNFKSALAVGRAQAVAILAAANKGIECFEYTPAQVKQRVANYGTSSKEQIQEMVRLQLGLAETPEPSDAADALAVALCHIAETRFREILAKQR